MKKNKKIGDTFFTYKGKPLVRCGSTLYYGDMNDQYVIKIESKSSKKVDDLEISTNLSVEMIDTNADIISGKKIVKVSEKKGLYLALDIADAWLARAANA